MFLKRPQGYQDSSLSNDRQGDRIFKGKRDATMWTNQKTQMKPRVFVSAYINSSCRQCGRCYFSKVICYISTSARLLLEGLWRVRVKRDNLIFVSAHLAWLYVCFSCDQIYIAVLVFRMRFYIYLLPYYTFLSVRFCIASSHSPIRRFQKTLKTKCCHDANFVVTGGSGVITSGATNGNKVGIMTTLGFTWTKNP